MRLIIIDEHRHISKQSFPLHVSTHRLAYASHNSIIKSDGFSLLVRHSPKMLFVSSAWCAGDGVKVFLLPSANRQFCPIFSVGRV